MERRTLFHQNEISDSEDDPDRPFGSSAPVCILIAYYDAKVTIKR